MSFSSDSLSRPKFETFLLSFGTFGSQRVRSSFECRIFQFAIRPDNNGRIELIVCCPFL